MQVHAQTTVQVATKHLEKIFEPVKAIKIDAEKADITIESWAKNNIQISIDLSSKHPQKEIAAADLEYFKYVAEKRKDMIFIKNYILLNNPKQKLSSNFKAKYILKIPENMELEINNSFGKIIINAKPKSLILNAAFCIVNLNNCDGKTKLETQYGDLFINNISGENNIRTNHTTLIMSKLGGKNIIQSQSGKIVINGFTNMIDLKIKGAKTEINLERINTENYGFMFQNKNGEINVPSNFINIKKAQNVIDASLNPLKNPIISITNSGSKISLNL